MPRNFQDLSPKFANQFSEILPQISPNSSPKFLLPVQRKNQPKFVLARICFSMFILVLFSRNFSPNLKKEPSRCRNSTCLRPEISGNNFGELAWKFRGSNSGRRQISGKQFGELAWKFRGSNSGNWLENFGSAIRGIGLKISGNKLGIFAMKKFGEILGSKFR